MKKLVGAFVFLRSSGPGSPGRHGRLGSRMRAANRCFVCGQDNPIGLKLKFSRVGEGVQADFTPSDLHAGYEGLVHGGILAALIDDAMANIWFARGQEAVTAKIEIRFRQEAKPGDRLLVSAEPAGSKGGLRIARATVTRGDGGLVAEGSGVGSIQVRPPGPSPGW